MIKGFFSILLLFVTENIIAQNQTAAELYKIVKVNYHPEGVLLLELGSFDETITTWVRDERKLKKAITYRQIEKVINRGSDILFCQNIASLTNHNPELIVRDTIKCTSVYFPPFSTPTLFKDYSHSISIMKNITCIYQIKLLDIGLYKRKKKIKYENTLVACAE